MHLKKLILFIFGIWVLLTVPFLGFLSKNVLVFEVIYTLAVGILLFISWLVQKKLKRFSTGFVMAIFYLIPASSLFLIGVKAEISEPLIWEAVMIPVIKLCPASLPSFYLTRLMPFPSPSLEILLPIAFSAFFYYFLGEIFFKTINK